LFDSNYGTITFVTEWGYFKAGLWDYLVIGKLLHVEIGESTASVDVENVHVIFFFEIFLWSIDIIEVGNKFLWLLIYKCEIICWFD
jgi:hypothetical protein